MLMTERDILHRLTCRGKTTSLSSEPAGRSCDGCQRMPNFDSCQFIFVQMAYITDRVVSIFVQDLLWHLTSAYGRSFGRSQTSKLSFTRIHWAPHARAKASLIIKLQFNYFLIFTLSVGRFSWAGKQHLLKSIAEYMFLVKSNCGLLSMLHSDWLSYY